jgi:hypothetical protein
MRRTENETEKTPAFGTFINRDLRVDKNQNNNLSTDEHG